MTAYRACTYCGITKTYHGPECMEEWIAWAKGQVPPFAKQHTVTILSGERGSGKSGGGIIMAKKLQVQPFVVREQVYFRPSDRVQVARRLGKGFVVYGDESTGEGGHKRRAMSTPNVENVMDIDVMRQRNQHTIFTAPDFKSLDPGIKDAVQWVHHFNHAHEVTSYEVIKPAKPDSKYPPYLKERFRTEDFPHAEIMFPQDWADLMEAKDDYLAGRDAGAAAKNRAAEDRMERIMINLVQSARPRPAPTQFPEHLMG